MARTVYYFDAGRGISGDMVVAALLDLSQDKKGLEKILAALPLKGAQIQIGRVNSHGIEATDFDVRLPKPAHEHEAGHAHMHRNLADVESVIDAAPLSERAAELAKKIFRIVAEAEARVHGKSVSDVHFHEVGALDSIADIVSAAYLIDQLGMEQIAFSPLAEGTGSVMCQHGWLPVPVPAVAEIARAYRVPLRFLEEQGEHVTPTGIAIAAALANTQKPEQATITAVGVGAGKRDFGQPNILRVFQLTTKEEK